SLVLIRTKHLGRVACNPYMAVPNVYNKAASMQSHKSEKGMTANLIQSLMSPDAFPHGTSDIQLLETHISWVLLTGEFAYKIKKPVNLGFLDFSTLAKRKFYCDEELRLNTRFSAGLYLAVVAITGSAEKPAIDGGGPVMDYAVKMRQFDQHDLLEQLAAADALNQHDIKSLARKLA